MRITNELPDQRGNVVTSDPTLAIRIGIARR
jgi:hypothetical protein